MVKLPASFVLADAATPVLSLTARTSAPGTVAPLESVTRPRIVPRGSCAKQIAVNMARVRMRNVLEDIFNFNSLSCEHCNVYHLKLGVPRLGISLLNAHSGPVLTKWVRP